MKTTKKLYNFFNFFFFNFSQHYKDGTMEATKCSQFYVIFSENTLLDLEKIKEFEKDKKREDNSIKKKKLMATQLKV